MSAYGAIERTNATILPSTAWRGKNQTLVTIHHLSLSTAKLLPGLIDYLGEVFAKEVEDGRTYPQEGPIDLDSFQKYFFAADVLVAIKGAHSDGFKDAAEVQIGIEEARNSRTWEECVSGYYYVRSYLYSTGFTKPLNFDTDTATISGQAQLSRPLLSCAFIPNKASRCHPDIDLYADM
jgi:hypothetical protein